LHPDRPARTGTPPILDQLALADLYDRGEVDRHLRRQRQRYRARRDALLAAVAEQLPEVEIEGAAAGLFAVLLLPDGADEAAIVTAAQARGVALEGLGTGRRPGLVAGYANLPEASAATAVSALAAAIETTGAAPTAPLT
jgi:GntR family transcriptional regulator/MocR family aminotransferase